jgi:hypothetical protein
LDRTALDRYLRNGLTEVKGWLSGGTEKVISEISLAQIEMGRTGSVGEIGVHQGKLLLLLLLTKLDGEGAFAIDPFEDDEINLAQNSPRSVDILQRHIASWAPKATRVQVIAKYSTAVPPSAVVSVSGRARLLSVDGSHEDEVVTHDMAWSEQVLEPHGIIIVDDFFNSQYPGVCSAVSRHIISSGSRLKPFAVSPGKLYVAQPEAGAEMRARLKQRFAGNFKRSTMMFGAELDIYTFPETGWKARIKSIARRILN